MSNGFKMKSLKLLANPHKLKDHKIYTPPDKLKSAIESKFNYELSNTTYQHIITIIRIELVIDALLNDIINRVILGHNP